MFTILNIKCDCFPLKDEECRLRASEKKSAIKAIYTFKSLDTINSVQFILVYYTVAFLLWLLPCFVEGNLCTRPPHQFFQIYV